MNYHMDELLTTKFEDMERKIYSAVCEAARNMTRELLEELDRHLMNTRDKNDTKINRSEKRRLRQYMGKSNITATCIWIEILSIMFIF